MSDRSLTARDRPSLVTVYRYAQAATYAAAFVVAALAFTQPAFMAAAANVCRQLIAIILN